MQTKKQVGFNIFIAFHSSLQTNTGVFVIEPFHQDLHCFQSCNWFVSETPISNNEYVQIQKLKYPFQKLRGESFNIYIPA